MREKADILNKDAFRLELTIQQNKAEFDGSKKVMKHLMVDLAKKHFTCSLCKQQLDTQHQKQHIKQVQSNIKLEKEKRIRLEKIIAKDIKKYNNLTHEISQLNYGAALEELQEKFEEVKSDIKEYYNLKKDRKNCLKEIEKIKLEKPSTIKLEEVKKEITTLKNKKGPIEEYQKVLNQDIEDCDWVIKDPLSNSGIKSFIFSQMVKKVNAKLTNYSHIINGLINFGVDLGSGNRDFYITIEKEGHLRFYSDQSGGEQQLINVCIAFSMYDTISESNPFNLLVFDEIFEGLDPKNVEIVGELVKQKSKNKCIFVITHSSNFIPNGSNIIKI